MKSPRTRHVCFELVVKQLYMKTTAYTPDPVYVQAKLYSLCRPLVSIGIKTMPTNAARMSMADR